MLAINLTADEMDALEGLPYLVICLYVMAIRPRMDYQTRLVGIRPRISRQALAEWIYVDPLLASRSAGRPSIKQLRYAIGLLEQAGLLQTKPAERQLIFFLPKARQGKSVSDSRGRDGGRDKGRPEAAPNMDYSHTRGRDSGRDRGLHQKQALESKPTPTPSLPEGAPVGVVDLNFESTSFQAAQQQAIETLLCKELHQCQDWKIPAQLLLDECTGQGRIREIKNPLGYLRTLARRFVAGQFTPELAGQIKAGRQKKHIEPDKPTVFVRKTPAQLAELRAGLGLPRPDGHGKG
jgi:hypothetical protein